MTRCGLITVSCSEPDWRMWMHVWIKGERCCCGARVRDGGGA